MSTNKRNMSEPEVVTSIRLTPDQHDRLKKLAASQHRSMSQQMRVVIDRALADHDAQQAA